MNREEIRQKLARLRELQQKPVEAPGIDTSQHTCRHCGYEFLGRQCPMCGMPGGWTRFTWQRLLNGFLDIWGLGNRPMFRSIGHLMWRPGYMIRDYLGGHYLSYFPPFKMLAVLTVFVAFTIWLLGIDTSEATNAVKAATEVNDIHDDSVRSVMALVSNVRDFLLGNMLYRLLLQVLMVVLAMWIVFRRKGLNLVETFFAMIYLSCQMQLVTIVWLVLTRTYVTLSAFPYALPEAIVMPLLFLDLRQLYHLKMWETVWRMVAMLAVLLLLYLVALMAIVVVIIAGAGILRLFGG